ATGASKDEFSAGLIVSWTAGEGYRAMLVPKDLARIEAATIKAVGTSHSFDFDPQLRALSGVPVDRLRGDIAEGRRLRLTLRMPGGRVEEIDFPVANGAMGIEALDACANVIDAHPIPLPNPAEDEALSVGNYESSCMLTRLWSRESPGIWLVIEAGRRG